MSYIIVKSRVPVEDVLGVLNLEALPDGCPLKIGERVSFDDCEVLSDDAAEALDDAGEMPESEELRYQFDETDVIGLAEAIRSGDTAAAELLLDKLLGEDPTVGEWIQRGRYSRRARQSGRSRLAQAA
jgi:hypothetical protein